MVRARWFSPLALVLAVTGGMIGVAARAVIVVPAGVASHPIVVPAVTLGINVLGSFLLGVIVGWADERHPRMRVFLGTGVMGGFTTYSAFAVHAVTVSTDAPFVGLALIALSLLGGVLAAAAGLGLGVRFVGGAGEAGPLSPEDAE